MQANFLELPPAGYLMQVLYHSPRSALTYIELWRNKNDDNMVIVGKKESEKKFLINRIRFQNDLMVLAREGLISVRETVPEYEIELTGFDIDEY